MEAGTGRILLGVSADISGMTAEPSDPPTFGAGVWKNLFTQTFDPNSPRRFRFNVIQCVCKGMAPDSAIIVPYTSMKNAAPHEYVGDGVSVGDDGTDEWISLGGQQVKRIPDENGGTSFWFRAADSALFTLKVKSVIQGSGSDVAPIPAKFYGLFDRSAW